MPIHYLLPCPNCEHQFSLTTSQAGQPLECPECSNATNAPKLGTLKQLPVSEGSSTTPTATTNGTIGWKRYVFVLGLVTAVVAGIAGVSLYSYSQSLFTPADVEGHISLIDQDLDQCSPVVLWDIWHDPSRNFEEGLGEWAEPTYARYNKQSAILKNFAYGLLGLAGLGALTLLSSFAIKQ